MNDKEILGKVKTIYNEIADVFLENSNTKAFANRIRKMIPQIKNVGNHCQYNVPERELSSTSGSRNPFFPALEFSEDLKRCLSKLPDKRLKFSDFFEWASIVLETRDDDEEKEICCSIQLESSIIDFDQIQDEESSYSEEEYEVLENYYPDWESLVPSMFFIKDMADKIQRRLEQKGISITFFPYIDGLFCGLDFSFEY